MENNRQNASGWFYERAELHGIELWGTGAALDHSTVPKGFHCYDLYTKDENNVFIANKPVKEEAVGAVLSKEPLPFQGRDSLSIQGIQYFEEEPMQTLDEIVSTTQQMGETQQEPGLQMKGM